jgi:hypothetical protein
LASTPRAAIEEMAGIGFRGIRLNLESGGADPHAARAALDATAEQIKGLGWHVQFYIRLLATCRGTGPGQRSAAFRLPRCKRRLRRFFALLPPSPLLRGAWLSVSLAEGDVAEPEGAGVS